MALCIVGDTISEIMERMSSLPVLQSGSSITENIKNHLSTIKEVVVDAKLHQNDDETRAWMGEVSDVVTDLGDMVEDAAMLQKPTVTSLFSFCKLTLDVRKPLLQLNQIQERLQRLAAGAHAIKLSPNTNWDVEEPEIQILGRDDEKKEIMGRIFPVEGAVEVVGIVGFEGIGKTKLAKHIFDYERVESEFGLRVWIDCIPDDLSADLSDLVVKRMVKKKAEDEGRAVMDENLSLGEAVRGSRFFVVLDDLRNENQKEWLWLHHMLTEAATPTGSVILITTRSDIVAKMVDSDPLRLGGLKESSDCWSLFEQVAGECPDDSKIRDAQEEMVKMCKGVPLAIETMARLVRSRKATTKSQINELKDEFMQQLLLRYYYNLPSCHLKQCFAYSSLLFSAIDSYELFTSESLIRLWMAEGFLGPINSGSPQQPEPEDLGLECIQEFCRRSILYAYENKYGVLTYYSMHAGLIRAMSAFVAGDDNLSMHDLGEDIKERVRRVSLTSEFEVSTGIPKSLFKNNANLRTILFPRAPTYRVPYEVKLSWSACDAIFSSFKRLRVLTLQDLGMKTLPGSVRELKSLRYLDLSHNSMRKLPSSIGELKHLQTLILSHCHELRELPNNIDHFVSLRHLELEECLHLKRMPSALKKLTWLRTLSLFVASTSNNGGLEELIHLNNLRGRLEISHLERMKFDDREGHAYLKEKEHLQFLTLRWNHEDEADEVEGQSTGKHDGKDEAGEVEGQRTGKHDGKYEADEVEGQSTGKHDGKDEADEVEGQSTGKHDGKSLVHLEPHPNLQRLSIVGYEGKEFSGWLSSLTNLVNFSLLNCSECKYIPSLDQLPKLKSLRLQRLDSLEFITDDHDNMLGVADTESLFTSLKELTISDCPNLTSWWKGRTVSNAMFPAISTLEVKYCPKLDCMPLYPSLDRKLTLECSSLKPLVETINYKTASDSDSCHPLSKLKELVIVNVEEQSRLLEDWLKNFTSLQFLSLRECKGFKSLMKGFKHLTSLDYLRIRNCTEVDLSSAEWEGLEILSFLIIQEMPKLESLPEGIKFLSSLTDLIIESCPELTTLTEGIRELKSLEYLRIEECHKLAELPQGLSNLTSLSRLWITNCPLLLPRCQKETGDDWDQIKHIESVHVVDTSEYYE